MKLLKEPISRIEKDNILRCIDGNICRICVSDDIEEVIAMLGFAIDRLSILAYSRVIELNQRSNLTDIDD